MIISNEKANDIGTTDVTITWDTNKNATSRVIYSSSDESYVFDWTSSPNYGYSYSTPEYDTPAHSHGITGNHTVHITGLSEGTTYYYRCVSHASPDTVSLRHSFTTKGVAGAETEGEEEEGTVEGTSTVAEAPSPVLPWYPTQEPGEPEEEPEEGEVEGTTTEETFAEESRPSMLASMLDALRNIGCLPWWLILILALYPLYKLLEKRDEIKRELDGRIKRFLKEKQKIWFSWFLMLVVLALVFYFIGYRCIALWILVILLLVTLGIRIFLNRKYKKG